uniref:Uncharacterized protein n=1 Tax=Photinus pyralis TaxID=7054 RepID=A0A1Y1N309_PHOPY
MIRDEMPHLRTWIRGSEWQRMCLRQHSYPFFCNPDTAICRKKSFNQKTIIRDKRKSLYQETKNPSVILIPLLLQKNLQKETDDSINSTSACILTIPIQFKSEEG